MRDRLGELGSTTTVVLVTFTDPANLVAYGARNDLPFPILVDGDRSTYRAYGLGRGTIARMYGWRAGRRYWELYREQGRLDRQRATEDTLQLGGDFVIAPDGTLTYGFWGAGPDERPSVDELIAAVSQADR